MAEITIACGDYDRTRALLDGRVHVDGVEATFVNPPTEVMFAKALDEVAFDASELSFSNYLYLQSCGKSPYIGLPVFPSRVFRHSSFYIRTDRGIKDPSDLVGKKVGVREYSMTAALVARGILADEYGVRAHDIRWIYGPAESDDGMPIARMQPRGVDLSPAPQGANLSDMLEHGELDALVAYKPPTCFTNGTPNVQRLFPDYRQAEEDYYRRTRIFPIMHLMGVRRDLAADAPELCVAICDAFAEAKRIALDELTSLQTLAVSLPWAPAETSRIQELMGVDWWPYGIATNTEALKSLTRYSAAQGIADRELEIADLFHPAVLEWPSR